MTAVVVWHCRTCRERVDTYRPTGTNVVRAARHPESAFVAGGFQCAGSFAPVDSAADVARDHERTEQWRTRLPDSLTGADRMGGGQDPMSDYLYLKGEL